MTRGENLAILNGIICILDILKMLINPNLLKDKELIEATKDYIASTEKMLKEVKDE